jgi:hypothetical protein
MSSIHDLGPMNRFAPPVQLGGQRGTINPKFYEPRQQESAFGNFAGGLGTGLGSSITSKLQEMLANKKRDQQFNSLRSGLEKSGINKELLDSFGESNLPINELPNYLKIAKDYASAPQSNQERKPLEEVLSDIDNLPNANRPGYENAVQEQIPEDIQNQPVTNTSQAPQENKIEPKYFQSRITPQLEKEKIGRPKEEQEAIDNRIKRISKEEDSYLRDERKKVNEFLKKKSDQKENAKLALETAEKAREIRKRGNLGIGTALGSFLSGEGRYDRSAYETNSSKFMPFYVNMLKPISEGKLKIIANKWITSPWHTDESNKAKEDVFANAAEIAIEEAKLYESLRDSRGLLPENVEEIVQSVMGPKKKALENILEKGTPEMIAKQKEFGKVFDNLPSAAEYTKLKFKDPNGNIWVSDGNEWRLK